MNVFVTGASGWIGSAVVAEFLNAGHKVVGLARSDAAAAIVSAQGAEVRRGDLDDLDGLRAGAAAADAVIHLGYNHDFSRMGDAAATDLAAVNAIGEVLEGSDRPFAIASGVLGLSQGEVATERVPSEVVPHPRAKSAIAALSFADRGVRSSILRFSPTVHGDGDHGFIAHLVGIARDKGAAAYVDDGANRWPAVHRLDAAALVRLVVENGPAGTVAHAVAEEGVPARDIAAAIGRGLGLPVISVPADRAMDHFGWMGRFFGLDGPASSAITRAEFGWTPTHPSLLEDLGAGYYFKG